MTVADDLKYNLENNIDSKEIIIKKGEVSKTVRGLCSFHNLEISPDGLPVNGTNIHILVAISTLSESFEIYKKEDLVSFKGYEVRFITSAGREIVTKIKSTMPDYMKDTVILICEFKRD